MRVRPDGFKRIRTKLEALQLSAGDLQGPVLRVMDTVHSKQVQQAFATRGASVATGPWPAWSTKYARWRARHPRTGRRMMRLTDSLYGKATSPNHGGHVARWLGRLRFAFGFVDDVGFYHQHGMGHLPVRSVIDKTEPQRRQLTAAFVIFYRARIRQVLRQR
jgi:hypothetical protein